MSSVHRGGAMIHIVDQRDNVVFQDVDLGLGCSSPTVSAEPGLKPQTLLSVNLYRGGGTGVDAHGFRVYTFSAGGVTVAYDGDLSGYWDNCTSFDKYEYAHAFIADGKGQLQMVRRGELRQQKCPQGVSCDQCYALKDGKEEVTLINELWQWDEPRSVFVLAKSIFPKP